MPTPFLDAAARHPMRFPDGRQNPCMVQLNRVIDHPNFDIGNFTYANDFDPPEDWAPHLAPYTYPGAPERLVIGRFGQIAHGVRFITASANHATDGVSTHPFPVFNPATLPLYAASFTDLPDSVIGHDVWIGHGALILPGARIGHGAIIGAGAVVAGRVPAYAVAAGNPARVVRLRFPPLCHRPTTRAWLVGLTARANRSLFGANHGGRCRCPLPRRLALTVC